MIDRTNEIVLERRIRALQHEIHSMSDPIKITEVRNEIVRLTENLGAIRRKLYVESRHIQERL